MQGSMDKKRAIVLEWSALDEDESGVAYLLDGKELGKDDPGFSAVLRKLERLERGARLEIVFPLRADAGGGEFETTLPFRARLAEFSETVEKRMIHVTYRVKGDSP